jgi:hypothetical protein
LDDATHYLLSSCAYHHSILYQNLTLNVYWVVQEFPVLEKEQTWYGCNAKALTEWTILVQVLFNQFN